MTIIADRTDDKARVKTRVGDAFPTLELAATSGQPVTVPDPAGDYVHLQLRRFAGCPICNLHLRSIVTRHDEIRSHGIREVVVFHSTAAEVAKHQAELPFLLVADPERVLYPRLGTLNRRQRAVSFGAATGSQETQAELDYRHPDTPDTPAALARPESAF